MWFSLVDHFIVNSFFMDLLSDKVLPVENHLRDGNFGFLHSRKPVLRFEKFKQCTFRHSQFVKIP